MRRCDWKSNSFRFSAGWKWCTSTWIDGTTSKVERNERYIGMAKWEPNPILLALFLQLHAHGLYDFGSQFVCHQKWINAKVICYRLLFSFWGAKTFNQLQQTLSNDFVLGFIWLTVIAGVDVIGAASKLFRQIWVIRMRCSEIQWTSMP